MPLLPTVHGRGTTAAKPAAAAANEGYIYYDTTLSRLERSNGTTWDVIEGTASGTTVAYGCRIKRASGNVSIGNNTLTVITFDSEDFDTSTMHDTVTNNSRVVIPSISGVTTGLWSIKASGYTNATTRVDASLRKNAAGNPASGTILAFTAAHATNAVDGFHITTDAVFSATDYVELFVRSTGAAASVSYDADVSPIMVVSFLGKVT